MNAEEVSAHVQADAVLPGDLIRLTERGAWRTVTARYNQRRTVQLRFAEGPSAVLTRDSPVEWRPGGEKP
jgi:hypothetical protein